MTSESALRMTAEQTAFLAMSAYAEAFWERGLRSSDDIAVLLGIMHDDPATPADWAAAVDKVVPKRSIRDNARFTYRKRADLNSRLLEAFHE